MNVGADELPYARRAGRQPRLESRYWSGASKISHEEFSGDARAGDVTSVFPCQTPTMSSDLWPTFGETEPPATGLWPIIRTFARELEPRTGGQVLARLDAIKLPDIPVGRAFYLRFVATRALSRSVTMLQVVEQTGGLRLDVPGQPSAVVCTAQELTDFLGGFARSAGVAEVVRVLGGRPLA